MDDFEHWCVVLGDPVMGVDIIGPFSNADEAATYAESTSPNETWWVSHMTPPERDA